MNDWVEHNGKGFPDGLDPDDLVLTRRGNLVDEEPEKAGWWHAGGGAGCSNWHWPKSGPGYHFITHYRVVS